MFVCCLLCRSRGNPILFYNYSNNNARDCRRRPLSRRSAPAPIWVFFLWELGIYYLDIFGHYSAKSDGLVWS